MDAKTFVANWAQLKDELVDAFCDVDSDTLVRRLIDEMKLNDLQESGIRKVIDAALSDTMYGLLLGLDGAASIGNDQRSYRIIDLDDGQAVSDPGDLEAAAYDYFQAG